MTRLLEKYQKQVVQQLIKKFEYKNKLSVPKLLKIVVNMGVGKAVDNKKLIEEATKHLTIVTGQKPLVTVAKKTYLVLNSARVRQLDVKLRCGGKGCLNFWTV